MSDWFPVVVAGGGGAVIIGGWVLARRAREQKYLAHEQLGAALGFKPLGPRSFAPTIAGTRDGLGVLVQRVERRDAFLPVRLDVLLESKLALVPSGGLLLRPEEEPHREGPAEHRATLEQVLPTLSEAAAHVGGRVGFRSMDSFVAQGAFDTLVRLAWPAGWRHMLLRTWLPLEASVEDVQRALTGLLQVRRALERAPAVKECRQ